MSESLVVGTPTLKRVNRAIILKNGLVPPCSILLELNYGIPKLGSSLSKNTRVWTETSCAVMSHCITDCTCAWESSFFV